MLAECLSTFGLLRVQGLMPHSSILEGGPPSLELESTTQTQRILLFPQSTLAMLLLVVALPLLLVLLATVAAVALLPVLVVVTVVVVALLLLLLLVTVAAAVAAAVAVAVADQGILNLECARMLFRFLPAQHRTARLLSHWNRFMFDAEL